MNLPNIGSDLPEIALRTAVIYVVLILLLRLRGKGLKSLQRSGTGDLLVRVVVHTPTKPTDRGKALFTELEQLADSQVPPPHRPDRNG